MHAPGREWLWALAAGSMEGGRGREARRRARQTTRRHVG
jgi:hypothetical protein